MDRIAAFGRVVREQRKARSLSQTDLAYAAGLHLNFISLVERGKTAAGLDSIFAIADALGVPASVLITSAEALAAAPD